MHAVLMGLVLAAAGEVFDGASVTAGAGVANNGFTGGWGHVGLLTRRDFDEAFVEARGSVLVNGGAAGIGFQDLGTSFTVGRRFDGAVRELRLELLPFNAVRRLPMFDWANRYGLPPPDANLAPAVALELRTSWGALWLASRFRGVQNGLLNTIELRPDLFGGVQATLPGGLLLSLRGGWFQYGLNPLFSQQGIKLESRGLTGAMQLAWTWKEPVGPPVDFTVYAADPTRFERFFTLEARETPAAAWVAIEGGIATQSFADPAQFGVLKEQPAWWVDAQARVRIGELRLFATGRAQSVTQLTFDAPGIPPFFALAANNVQQPALAGFLGADWRWATGRLTPGVLVSVQRHASITTSIAALGAGTDTATRTLLVTTQRSFIILPIDEPVQPVLSVRASLRWDPVPMLSALLYVDVERDWNRFGFTDSLSGAPTTQRVDRVDVRAQLQLQARF